MSTIDVQEEMTTSDLSASAAPSRRPIDKASLSDNLTALSHVRNVDQLVDYCGATVRSWGADHFVYRAYLPIPESVTTLSNLNQQWLKFYEQNQYAKVDPCLVHCYQNSTPIRWIDVRYRPGKLGKMEEQIMKEASGHGQNDGISIPVHGVGSEAAFFSVSSMTPLRFLSDIDIQMMTVFASNVHEHVKRINQKVQPEALARVELTRREKECMKWTAEGKTSWEISQIIGRSETTVVFHIGNVIRKFGATNRVEAVAKYVKHGHSQVL